MKSSKKFMTRVLTAALALSMVAGTGICAAAVEDTEPAEEPVVVIAPEDETPGTAGRLDAVKAMLAEAAQGVYAKLSQSTAAQLIEIAKEVKMAEQIMASAAYQETQIKVEVSENAVAIMEAAEAAAAEAENEEEAAQIIAEAEQEIAQLVEEAEQQVKELMTEAQQASDELLAEAAAQLEALKAQLKTKKTQRVAALMEKIAVIQQNIETVKAQFRAMAAHKMEELREIYTNAYNNLVEKTTQVSYITDGDFGYQIRVNKLFHTAFAIAISYSGDEEEVTIPDYVGEYPVEELTLLTEGVVKTLNLPATIKDITGVSFVQTKGLENINVDEDNPFYQSIDGVVFTKSGNDLAAVPNSREYNAPEGIEAVGDGAYFGSQMEGIVLPSTVKYIGDNVFFGCENLKKVVVPINVIIIGDSAFAQTSEDLVIYCDAFSYAAYYAEEKGLNYEAALGIRIGIGYEDENAYENDVMALGTAVHFMAEAAGGSGEYVYACYYRKAGDEKWTVKQGLKTHNEANEFSIKPKTAGDYEVCIKVKDSDGTLKKMYYTFTVEQ